MRNDIPRNLLINMARKAMINNINSLDKETLRKELRKALLEKFKSDAMVKNLENALIEVMRLEGYNEEDIEDIIKTAEEVEI